MRTYLLLSVALLTTVTFHAQGTSNNDKSSGRSVAKESSADPEQAQSPREYIESRLGGKIIKLERDPEALPRAVLFVERNGSVTRHVLKVGLNSKTDLREVRIVTPNADKRGFPPVVVIPRALISPCWFRCKNKCGLDTQCRVRCLFDCIVSKEAAK